MLIKNEVELKAVLGGIQQSITWETMEPFVRQAESEFIVPVIGEAFYDEISTEAPTDIQQKLIDKLVVASANYALANSLAQMVVSVGDLGASINTPGSQSPLPKWTYVELKKSAIDKADKALESALAWLEKNETEFDTWTTSDECTISKELFINSATDLNQYFPPSRSSRRMYLAIREYLRQAETFYLEPEIGAGLIAYLKEKSADATLSAVEKTAVKSIKYYLANKAVSMAVPYLNINPDFRLVSESSLANVSSEDALDTNRRDGLKLETEKLADWHLDKLKSTLDASASATVFTPYFSSDQYAASVQAKPYFRKKNDPSKSYCVI